MRPRNKNGMFTRSIMVTGGCGFIGSHVVNYLIEKYPNYKIVVVDKLSYAGNMKNLSLNTRMSKNLRVLRQDICDYRDILLAMKTYKIDGIIHLAAESHVDNSIKDPFIFAKTNVMGTLSLLHAAKTYWSELPEGFAGKMFYHISTDEVYGSLEHTAADPFTEENKYDPHSPYSASKASSDHFVRAYHDTYGMPTIISNCSNNYGPNQYPEKLIPLVINKIKNNEDIPIYGNGTNVRDWLYVGDHAKAIDIIFHHGKPGETYNIGGNNEKTNIEIVKKIINITDRLLNRPHGASLKLITYVTDRLGHDFRYAIDSSKLQDELGWRPEMDFDDGIEETVKWYLEKNKN